MRKLKKYGSGEGAQYMTRRQALKKLQLSLQDFRRLCILKGIYPREPKNRKRAQHGSSEIKILYHVKDIKFLLHEKIVWSLRDIKIFKRRAARDRAIQDFQRLRQHLSMFPEIKLDHIVKERYPTFIDAIKDLDDCLTLLFLFSTFPSLKYIPREQSQLCRRLTIEFLLVMIHMKALRKVFISIKGYYFQADIKGHKITWIVPHYYPFKPEAKSQVDFKVMSIFVEFYTVMLGFINYRLYTTSNLSYPPRLPKRSKGSVVDESNFVSHRIASLNSNLMKVDTSVQDDDDDVDLDLLALDGDSARVKKLKSDAQDIRKLKVLFKGLKFFINREVPREPLVFIIRSFGGKVSWDRSLFPGASFDESDETITHQIVDRPMVSTQYISRDYIQPQWIFDSVNQISLLPTNKYFIGAVLPPHLSPFVDASRDDYIPPEEKALLDPSLVDTLAPSDDEDEVSDDEDVENPEKSKDEPEQETFNEGQLNEELERAFQSELNDDSEPESESDDAMDNGENEELTKEALIEQKKKAMKVEPGKLHKEHPRAKKWQEIEEHRLKAQMVKPRHRNLFRKLIRKETEQKKEKWLLEKKRKRIETQQKQEKKLKKKMDRQNTLKNL